ncbi:MAG: hypothetical protein WDN26_05545 [Chitinophagaceae bacterium]
MKLITPKKINVLGVFRVSLSILLTALFVPALAQDNSPYSRYGLGDAVPSTNINSRAMGGISAGYNDLLSINFNNPATYGSFQSLKEQLSNKISRGKAILDVGINYESRTLREPNNVSKFTASNLLFSHIQLGIPLRRNWGLSFGLRPVNRISYKIVTRERLKDPITSLPIDSAVTLNEGDGGAYLASIGTGFKIELDKYNSISFGINGGYLFGKKDYSTRRTILNDSLAYNSGNFETETTYGNLYANAGLQFQHWFNDNTFFTFGAFGNWKQKLNATQDVIRETYYYDEAAGYARLDSVYDKKGIKGKIIYPSSVTAGFVIGRTLDFKTKKAGWLLGIDYSQSKWNEYRFYGQPDPTVKDNWQLRVGGQFNPFPKANYFSNVAYRAGFSVGPDYIHVNNKLPLLGISMGFGLPLINYNRLNEQSTFLNISLEYIKRGNNNNVLKENLFRLSIGVSLSDVWFVKKKYG